jgi:SAM-dependent methyltransferase
MKGFVPTPAETVDLMVEKLFSGRPPSRKARLLDPGCGPGAFIDGVLRWADRTGCQVPEIVGVDSDPKHVRAARKRFAGISQITIEHDDFLAPRNDLYDYVIGNPPYVPITGLDAAERARYRAAYKTATQRFDLYLLFFEQALQLLAPRGRLVFITPEKFLYVETGEPLRRILDAYHVSELHFAPETTFGEMVTYPLITTLEATDCDADTLVIHRNGARTTTRLRNRSGSWMPAIRGVDAESHETTLADLCIRISCGVATGADSIYVVRNAEMDPRLQRFARPTLAGRQIRPGKPVRSLESLLVPYGPDGTLLSEPKLGALAGYLADSSRRQRLMSRTCVARKPWYAFHETPPLADALRPKILCKDVCAQPFFVADPKGDILPRHSVYYIVPRDPTALSPLLQYLNSELAIQWLQDHCQRAANGFVRLQSHVLKRLPLPDQFSQYRTDHAVRPSARAKTA